MYPMSAADHLHPDQHRDVIAGMLRAHEHWQTLTPEQRTAANQAKAEIPQRLMNLYDDRSYSDAKGSAMFVRVPLDVKDHGAWLADYAAKNPPATPKGEKKPIDYSNVNTKGP